MILSVIFEKKTLEKPEESYNVYIDDNYFVVYTIDI